MVMKFAQSGLFILLFILFLVFVVYQIKIDRSWPEYEEEVIVENLDTVQVQLPALLYGFPADSFKVVESTIRRNQFLGEILSEYQVTDQQIHDLSMKSRKVYDVRRLEARKKYTILCTKDTLPRAEYFIYEPNAIDYVVYKLKDSIEVSLNQRKIDTVKTSVAGIIENSLWVTMTDAGADPLLIHSLSEVFAWQVDFYRIQKGDRFKVLYEQLFVDDEEAGIGKSIFSFSRSL